MSSPLPSAAEIARRKQSLNSKINNEAKRRGVPANSVRYQFVFQVFLRRVFKNPADTAWSLRGGTSLLLRTGGGRFTQDIDLARAADWASVEDVREELRQVCEVDLNDHFQFELVSVKETREDSTAYGRATLRAVVKCLLGLKEFQRFSVDISPGRHTQTPAEIIEVKPVIKLEDGPEEPFAIRVTPIESHLADKVCALYEDYGVNSNTRYRDLADIVRIIMHESFSAERLLDTLYHESHRRGVTLPKLLHPPHSKWEEEYHEHAQGFFEFPKEYATLDASLDYSNNCLAAVLDQSIDQRLSWDPIKQEWHME
ncbi:nucleotidyl transferase AbiEii/AbiGii toxin family protein [Corynebacterium pilosum]|uniref:nucleotidyl transferase AbiEii/AbiGii toxin family protein n=1 Tax=Corynebacterium pilosum TaxID=35756 RepID=UPI00058CAA44|nr:nucleotidyl transferase AbiEii/AbiGii toxin family protein [Corynebacterium pilosum]